MLNKDLADVQSKNNYIKRVEKDSMNVLLIEDNPDDVKIISHYLKKSIKDISIMHTDSFDEVMQILQKVKFDIILTDYNCESFTGLEIVAEIRSKAIKTPIILITASRSTETALASLLMHVDDYVVKDIKYLKQLPAIIDRVLKKTSIKRDATHTANSTLYNFINSYENSSELIQTVWLDGSIMNVNNAWRETLEYKSRNLNDLDLGMIIDDEWFSDYEGLMNDLKKGKKNEHLTLGFKTKSGKKLLMECYVTARIENGKPVASHWVMRNIDAINEDLADTSLSDINAQYLSVFEYASVPLIMEDNSGAILQLNKAACDLIGYSYDEMIGMRLKKITHEDDLTSSLENQTKLLSGELDNYTMALRFKDKQGHYVPVEVTNALIRDEEGKPHLSILELRKL